MKASLSLWVAVSISLSALLSSCANSPTSTKASSKQPAHMCKQQGMLGKFNLSKDFLIANFDSKTDPDDLHSIAAVGTMLLDPRFQCVNYIATAGAYGKQEGAYIKDTELFNLTFGKRWVDADGDRSGAINTLANKAITVLEKGGDIWIIEAGQSDVSAGVVRQIQSQRSQINTKERIHIVQHSTWNENETTPEALAFVREHVDYQKVPDGNATGNGTPGFNAPEGAAWAAVLARTTTGAIWARAQHSANNANAANAASGKGYVNHNILTGGFDFSDAVEATWIFGFNDLKDANSFFETFK